MAAKKARKSARRTSPGKRKVPSRWQDRTDDDWERWGKNLGKRIERRFKNFGKEAGSHGRRIEKHGKSAECFAKDWWRRTFGPLGPFIESALGVLCLCVGIIIINIINVVMASTFLYGISAFLYAYLAVFFVIMLFFNYAKYVCRVSPHTCPVIKPFTTAAGIAVAFWVISWGLLISFQSSGISAFSYMSFWISENLWGIFIALLVIAYIIAIIIRSHDVYYCKRK